VGTVLREINELRDKISAHMQTLAGRPIDTPNAMKLVVHHTSLERNVRCLLAYLYVVLFVSPLIMVGLKDQSVSCV